MDIKNLTNLTNEILRRLSEWMIKMTKTFSDGSTAVKTVVTDASGNQITSFGSPSTVADYRSPSDFTASFTTSSTLTLSGYNFQLDTGAQIVYIRQRKADNTANVYVNGASGYAFVLDTATGIVTIYKDGAIAAILVTGDMYEVGINSSTKGYDPISDSNKAFVNNYPVQPIDGELLNVALTDALTAAGCILNIAAANITPSGALKGTIAVGTGNDQVTAGQTYVAGQTLLITGGNTDAIVTVATVVAGTVGNKVATVTVVAGGSGYIVNATNATTLVTINYYPSVDGIDMGYYRNISFQYLANLTTPSNIYTAIEISNEDTPTMWMNATKTGYISAGSQAGSTGLVHILAENGAIDFDNILAKKVRLRSIIDANTTGAVYYSYVMKGV